MLQCARCQRLYAREQVVAGLYFLETMICAQCYVEMQGQPYEKSCFGKPTTILLPSRRRLLGYDRQAEECAEWCPDRFLCSQLVGK